MYIKKISFIADKEADMIYISAKDLFRSELSEGFIDYSNQKGVTRDKFIASGGWQPRDQSDNTVSTLFLEDTNYGVEHRQKGIPLTFRSTVPEDGVYSVTVIIHGGEDGVHHLNIYTGRRNLVKRDVSITPGETFSYRFLVRVDDYIAVPGKPPRLDQSIYVSVLGEVNRLSAIMIEKVEAPTLFIGGDSIVADYEGFYPYNPILNGGSWGQNILQYFNGLAIDNHAHGGMTTNCFREDGHWDIIAKSIRSGDIFMFQFGHNDQKRRYLSAFSGYSSNLRWYIHKVRSLGAIPIIVTSLSRMPSKDEYGYYDLLEEHAEACRRVGKEWKVPVIDLHQYSFDLLCKMDTNEMKGYFNDAAHTNDYGGIKMASFIANEIREKQILSLCNYMNEEDPAPWLPDETLRPSSNILPTDIPEKPILSTDLPELPYIDCLRIRQLDDLKRAMAFGLLDPCLKYFHPFEEIPRGQFLYLYFKAAKAPAKASYKGKYCDIYRYEFDASNVQAAIDMNLVDETTTPNERFRPDDGLTGGELLSFIIRYLHNPEDRNYSVPECEQQARSLGLIWEGYQRDHFVNRVDCAAALVHMMDLTPEQINGLPCKIK